MAVTGPPGSGKSTVAALACGLVQPDRGHVLVDGVDLAELDATHMLQAIRIVSEEPFLFADTLAENLLLGGHGDEAELRAAWLRPRPTTWSPVSTVGSTARSATAASRCRAGNASGSRSRVHSSTRRACWCSTTRSAR